MEYEAAGVSHVFDLANVHVHALTIYKYILFILWAKFEWHI